MSVQDRLDASSESLTGTERESEAWSWGNEVRMRIQWRRQIPAKLE